MSFITIESQRRDGKFMVRFEYPGAPNAFGGHYPARIFRKIKDRATLVNLIAVRPEDKVFYGPCGALEREVDAFRAARLVGAA